MNKNKLLIIVLVILLVGVGYYFLFGNSIISYQTPSEVVSAFYKNYQDCLKNPPQEAKGQVSVYCQNQTDLTTSDFAKNIDEGGIAKLGADPIGCAQNPPQNFLTSDANIVVDGTTATVVIKEFFGGPRLDIRVNLKKIGNEWKIYNIMCPRPDPASNPGITDSWATYKDDNSHISFKYPISAGSNFVPVVKTTSTSTVISIQSIGLEFSLVIQPIKPKAPQYFENSIFQESNQIGTLKWDVSLNMQPPFVAYQTIRNNTQYIFVFTHQTEKDELQKTILSTFKFLNPEETVVTTKIGETKNTLGISITPLEILEDSRCPQDVQCIQAGTVRLKTTLKSGMGTASQVFVTGTTITTETEEITLTEVSPIPIAGKKIQPNEYQFTFHVKKRL